MKQVERDELLQKLADGQTLMHDKIAKIERGLYGEPENNTLGLIGEQRADNEKFNRVYDTLNRHDERISDNEKFKKNVKKVGKNTLKIVGGSTVVGGGTVAVFLQQIKQFLITLFHINN